MSQAPPPADLDRLLDAHAILATEHQAHLEDLVEEAPFSVDLGAGTVTFHTSDPVTFDAQFVGSAASDSGTWMWGWNNVNDFPDAVIRAARLVRAYAQEHGIAELDAAQPPLADDTFSRFVLATKAVSGIHTHVVARPNEVAQVALLIDGPTLALPAPTLPRVNRVIVQAIQEGLARHHREAVEAYARERDGIELAWDEDGTGVVTVPDGVIRLEFDDLGRLTNASFTAGAGTPPEASVPAEAAAPSSPPAPEPEPRREKRGWFRRR